MAAPGNRALWRKTVRRVQKALPNMAIEFPEAEKDPPNPRRRRLFSRIVQEEGQGSTSPADGRQNSKANEQERRKTGTKVKQGKKSIGSEGAATHVIPLLGEGHEE
ncbi:hypothetical protein JD844_013986, partial [Phrynosoma platyrhinos]